MSAPCWTVEMKMHDGKFGTYSTGYDDLTKAKNAGARLGRGGHYATRVVRVVNDDTKETYESTFAPRARAKWEKVA